MLTELKPTLELVTETLEAIAAEQPDRTNPGGTIYFLPSGEPADLLGTFLARLDLDTPEIRAALKSKDKYGQVSDLDAWMRFRFEDIFGKKRDLRAKTLLEEAQRLEYNGKSWAKSVELAKRVVVRRESVIALQERTFGAPA